MRILDQARVTLEQRSEEYAHPKEDCACIAQIWSAIVGVDIAATKIPLMMIGLKLARESRKHKLDNLVDMCGYAENAGMLHE